MEELQWLEAELIEVYMDYVKEAKTVWTENDPVVADEMVSKLYRKYKSKQIYLERLIQLQKSVIDDIGVYKTRYDK